MMVLLPAYRGALLASVLLVLLSEARGDCGPPKAIPNAEIRQELKQSYPVGTSVRYHCIPGYEMSSPARPVAECLSTSEWAEVSVPCRRGRCPVPNIENGQIAGETELLLGESITFVCDEGHRVVGRNGARCVLRNNRVVWDNEPPHCERIPCHPPPEIDNGNHNGMDNYVYGTAVTYRCARDFSLIGKKTIVCKADQNENGKWSDSAPQCKVVSCITPEVPNGVMKTAYRPSYTYQDAVLFECKSGFKLKDNIGRTSCGANSTWDPLPKCIPDIHPTDSSGGDGEHDTTAGPTDAPVSPTDKPELPVPGTSVSIAVAIGAVAAVIAVVAIIVLALKYRARHKRPGKPTTGSAAESYSTVPRNVDISLDEKA